MELSLYQHQQALVDLNPAKYLLPWETGTGKTIGLVALMKKNNPINIPVLIITIKSDKGKWEEVVKKFDINADVMTKEEFRKATVKDEIKKVWKPAKANDPFEIIQAGGQMVDVIKKVPAPEKLKKYDYLVVDEAHFFAGLTSMLHKCLYAYIKLYDPQYIWLATATPYPGNPWNLYSLARLIGYDWNYKKFQYHFFQLVKMGPRMVPVKKKIINGRTIEKEIAAYINFLGKSVEIEKCVDMPEKVLIEEYFELTAEQKREYKNINEELVLTRNLKWHQICGGTLHDREVDLTTGEVIRDENLFFQSQKLSRVVELCEEHNKIFIVCKYQNEVDYIAKTLSDKLKDRTIMTFTGKNSAERPERARMTDNLSECIIIANAACSAAYECSTVPLMVFYSYDFSLVNYIQMIGRIRRISNPAPRTYLSLIIKDSIDEEVFKCIQGKKDFDAAIYKREK